MSKLIFNLANLRDFVNKYDEDLCLDDVVQNSNRKGSRRSRNPNNLVKFLNPTNVVTRHCKESERHLQSTLLKKPITLSEVVAFIRENRNLIEEFPGTFSDSFDLRCWEDRERHPDKFRKLKMEDDFEMLIDRKLDAEIWEFDDEFDDTELLFGIVVNRYEIVQECTIILFCGPHRHLMLNNSKTATSLQLLMIILCVDLKRESSVCSVAQ